jgi:hypothetical protein
MNDSKEEENKNSQSQDETKSTSESTKAPQTKPEFEELLKNLKDPEKLKQAIITGSVLASAIAFDHLTAEEWYEKDSEGNFRLRKRTIIQELFE